MLAIIGSGGGTTGTGTTVPGAGSQLYVSGNGSSTLMIYNDANTVSGTTAANRIVAGGMTTVSVPRGIAIDMLRNQLYVANTKFILVFNRAHGRREEATSAGTHQRTAYYRSINSGSISTPVIILF
jgi:DNA-binding beta-propeller fold protein YncE